MICSSFFEHKKTQARSPRLRLIVPPQNPNEGNPYVHILRFKWLKKGIPIPCAANRWVILAFSQNQAI
ncbi:protocatechuate 3,4-dioxygenase subunit beta [Desmospora sp. 8437]|nr:protocatechuate 3,4-dioxygenase subunit beta [Desmospora sp. 8437]